MTGKFHMEDVDSNGVYQGYAYIGRTVLIYRNDAVFSLGVLEDCYGVDIRSTRVKDLGNLKIVRGYMDIRDSYVTAAPHLERVQGRLFIDGVKSPGVRAFEKLRHVEDGFTIQGAPIPYLPSIDHNCLVDWYSGSDKPAPDNKALSLSESYYTFEDQVRNTPTLSLMSLRARKPHLEYLIDAKLKGILK